MLSVLIPVYNRDARTLTIDLLSQARHLEVPFEIIEDDASDIPFAAVSDFTTCLIVCLEFVQIGLFMPYSTLRGFRMKYLM